MRTWSAHSSQNFSGHAAALAATMPEQLGLMYATCSGSESNDLALRVAKKANLHGELDDDVVRFTKPTYAATELQSDGISTFKPGECMPFRTLVQGPCMSL